MLEALAAEVAALRTRLEHLEAGRRALELVEGDDPLAATVEQRARGRPEAGHGEPIGQIAIRGHVRAGGTRTVWAGERDVEGLLALPAGQVARALAGLAHPARIAIWRALLPEARDSRALLAAAGLNTTGQLYHHLRAMESAGLLERRGRNLWARRGVAAVLLALAAVAELSAGPAGE